MIIGLCVVLKAKFAYAPLKVMSSYANQWQINELVLKIKEQCQYKVTLDRRMLKLERGKENHKRNGRLSQHIGGSINSLTLVSKFHDFPRLKAQA